jgi:hypothetical protein
MSILILRVQAAVSRLHAVCLRLLSLVGLGQMAENREEVKG